MTESNKDRATYDAGEWRHLRERIRQLEDWHHVDRCRERWNTMDERVGRRLTVFGPEDGFASYSTNDRELWEVIEALKGAKEMDDESLSETARRVCNSEVHATIRDGVSSLMLKDLLDGLKQRGFPKLKIDAGGSVAAAILRSIDERIDDIIKAAQEVADDEHRAAKVERDGLLTQLAEVRGELRVRDRTFDQLADVAEERDALLVRVETLEQQAGRRPPNPMASTAPPDAWRPEETASYEDLAERIVALEAKMVGVPVDAEHLDRIGRRFERHVFRIRRIEALLAGDEAPGDDGRETLLSADLPSYRQLAATIDVALATTVNQSDRLRKLEEWTARKSWWR